MKMKHFLIHAILAALLTAAAGGAAPSFCARAGTPLQAPVVGGGSFGFSIAADDKASTIVVGQPDAAQGAGIVYAYNQVKLCAYKPYELPAPPPPPAADLAAGAAPPALLGMMTALSRDGRWLAVAGALERGGAAVQAYVYRRQSNDSTGGFVLHQKLPVQPGPTLASIVAGGNNASSEVGRVYSGSLSISKDGQLVLVTWSAYGAGRDSSSSDPYGPPSNATLGSAQLFRRGISSTGVGEAYARAQADLARLAPPLARTQFFGANSQVAADGSVAVISTRIIDAARPAAGAPALVVYQRLPTTGQFVHATTLRVPASDGAFAITDSGGHMAVVRGADVHVYAREGDVSNGKFVYNKRCTLAGDDMNLEANYTKLVLTAANNVTLRLAVSNSLDSVFVWSVPLGGERAYSDGACPATLDQTLSGDSSARFGAAIALGSTGRALVVGAPGSSSGGSGTSSSATDATVDGGVVVADISPPVAASPAPSPATSSGATSSSAGGTQISSAAAVPLDNTYFATNPSTVLVSARRGSVGVPASQPFSAASWAQGSPGGAPYSAAAAGYSISPQNPYMSGGTPVQSTVVAVTSALRGLGLTTAAVRSALAAAQQQQRSASSSATTMVAGGLQAQSMATLLSRVQAAAAAG